METKKLSEIIVNTERTIQRLERVIENNRRLIEEQPARPALVPAPDPADAEPQNRVDWRDLAAAALLMAAALAAVWLLA